jgi:isoleucyl-tRNA synthetase
MILDSFSPLESINGRWDTRFTRESLVSMAYEDQWIISRINSVAAQVDLAMKECQTHRATRALISFILEDLSRWYIQLIRPRMWFEGESAAKTDAYETMYYTMRRLCDLLSPFTPFITELMYQNIRLPGDPESVHMSSWSGGEQTLVNGQLEKQMDVIRSFDEAQANARQAGKRKLRWPVQECVVVTDDDDVVEAIILLNDICTDRANARSVRVVKGRYDRIGWRAEPVMKALGPSFGKNAPAIRELIRSADAVSLKTAFERGNPVTLQGDEGIYTISPSQVIFEEELPPSIFKAPMSGGAVYVDVTLTPELEAEGYAREVIRRTQEMRRLLDLRVEDFVTVYMVIDNERVASLLSDRWRTGILEEVRADSLDIRTGQGGQALNGFELKKDWDIEGILVTIGISKVADDSGKE